MRILSFLLLMAGPVGLAAAHLPPDESGIAGQVGHLLVAGHHLPLALLALIGLGILWSGKDNARRRR